MFGKNELRKREAGDGQTLTVQSIFYTIQGEGPRAGTPAVFIRLWGCNLRCYFCDTDFESNEARRSVEDIVDSIRAMIPDVVQPLVVISGGEPLRQNILPLIQKLQEAGCLVQIETAGTIYRYGLAELAPEIVVSPKTGVVQPGIQAIATAYKYIIRAGECDPVDGLPTKSTQFRGTDLRIARPRVPMTPIFVQPCDEGNAARNKMNLDACVSISKRFGYRLSVQLHKIVEIE